MDSLKAEALKMISRLADDVTLDDIMYHVYVLEKVRRGEEAIERGETLSCEELDEEVENW